MERKNIRANKGQNKGKGNSMVTRNSLGRTPWNSTITSQGVANLYREHIFKEQGLPKKVISNRGSQFVSGFMKGLYQKIGIEANPSTAYHPQTDGQTERVNQELEEYLRMYVNEKQNDWVDWLPIAQFCHND